MSFLETWMIQVSSELVNVVRFFENVNRCWKWNIFSLNDFPPFFIFHFSSLIISQLEGIFLALFRWANVQPVILPEENASSVLQLASSKGRSRENNDVIYRVCHIAGLLRPALILTGITISPVWHSSGGRLTYVETNCIYVHIYISISRDEFINSCLTC